MLSWTRPGAVIADVEIDQDVHRPARLPGGLLVPGGLLGMIHHDHGAGPHDSRHLAGIGYRRGQQQPGHGRFRHQLGFGERADADTARSGGDLALGDPGAFVRFRVRPQPLPGPLCQFRHAGQIVLERVEIEQQRGRRNFLYGQQGSIRTRAAASVNNGCFVIL